MRQSVIRASAVIATVAAMAACGSDSTAPADSVAGSYAATTFVTTGGSGQTNQLVAGSTLAMVLNSDGKAAREMIGNDKSPVRWFVIGISDE